MSTSTLLLVDDSVTIQRVIELTFADENVRVVSVADGRRAQQWMERQAPDIVLVDVGAPEVDGYAVASYVRQSPRLKHVPVLILAGVFEPVDEARAREAGSDGVLVKPFEPEHLVTRVRSLLRHAASRAAEDAGDGQTRPSVVMPFPGVTRLAVAPPPATIENAAEGLGRSMRDVREGALPSRMPVANAFSTLLATDQVSLPAAAPAQPLLTDVMVEDAVHRALVRMTEGVVRRIVVETAERLIKEEVEKIKGQSE